MSGAFNEAVMPRLYIDVSEMSIVGPPPSYLGGVFFLLKKQPLVWILDHG